VYWYDRPPSSPHEKGGAGGSKRLIGDEPELEFFDHVPTVWDETRVIDGRIGQYAVIARRCSQHWFIGCMNADKPRKLEIPLDFLARQKQYVAHIYRDDQTVPTRTHVRTDRRPVTAGTILAVSLATNDGQAIRIAAAPDAE